MSAANCVRRDHPREYGENRLLQMITEGVPGSSPRIRGESMMTSVHTSPSWIIPANTGRIPRRGGDHHCPWDHPREYGENTPVVEPDVSHLGSSPRIRGESNQGQRRRFLVRIIPANTGRICCAGAGCCCPWDHPREYGENAGIAAVVGALVGSSPRIRGEFNRHRLNKRRKADHPREYGENGTWCRNHQPAGGSSPRIRGE